MKYTLKEKFQIVFGTHPDTYPKESTFNELSPEQQREANRNAAREERKRQNQKQSFRI